MGIESAGNTLADGPFVTAFSLRFGDERIPGGLKRLIKGPDSPDAIYCFVDFDCMRVFKLRIPSSSRVLSIFKELFALP